MYARVSPWFPSSSSLHHSLLRPRDPRSAAALVLLSNHQALPPVTGSSPFQTSCFPAWTPGRMMTDDLFVGFLKSAAKSKSLSLIHPPQNCCVCPSLNAPHTQNPSGFLYPTISLRTVPSEVKAKWYKTPAEEVHIVYPYPGKLNTEGTQALFLEGTNKCRQGQVTSVPGAPMAGPSKWIAHRSDLCVMDPQQVVCPSHPFIQTCVEAVAAYKVHVVIEIDLGRRYSISVAPSLRHWATSLSSPRDACRFSVGQLSADRPQTLVILLASCDNKLNGK